MSFIQKFDIADNERAFLFKKNRFAGVLEPGRYRYVDLLGNIKAEHFDITKYELDHTLGKILVTAFSEQTRDYLEPYQLTDHEVGLVYRDGRLVDIAAPGSFKIYWKGAERIEMKRIDIRHEYRIPAELLGLLGRSHSQQLARRLIGDLLHRGAG